MADSAVITAERLRAILHYDPETGIWTWLIRPSDKVAPGTKTGFGGPSGFYPCIFFERRKYLAHRLAFLYMTGDWPPQEVDHINGDKQDNRWVNLRLASKSQNMANVPWKGNQSGFKGVTLHKQSGLWMARCRKRFFGYFRTAEEASEAYRKGVVEEYGEFARPE
jgi:hypothetical protein